MPRHALSRRLTGRLSRRLPSRRSRRLPSRLSRPGAVLAGTALAVGLAGALAAPASARIGSHDAVGHVGSIRSDGHGGMLVTGWASDPDAARSNASVSAVLDGRTNLSTVTTSVRRPKIARTHGTSATPGFAMDVDVPQGRHTVCVVARNAGMGAPTILQCVATPLGSSLTSAQLTRHDPVGDYVGAWAHKHTVHVRGWAYDPDLVSRRSTVVVYLDGTSAATVRTTRFAARPAAAGPSSLFDVRLPVSTGNHTACIWVVNAGLGDNSYLGCHGIDTRGTPGTGRVATPALNSKVVREAEKHIGQPYVWATEGPRTFDCSGLVMYSYHKFGVSTPRVARDQFHAARLIPASRAVPGDLVFYSTSEGYIHHVGVYTGPGMSVAAIDPAEGVDWQRIYPSDTVYYGSFTHV